MWYIKKRCESTFSPYGHDIEDKKWVVFNWMERPHSVTWKSGDNDDIDHRLEVKFFRQRTHESEECVKRFENVTQVDFVKQTDNVYAIDLYDSNKQKITHVYLNTQRRNFPEDKFKIPSKQMTENVERWGSDLHWDFTPLTDVLFRATMQYLPHAKANTADAPEVVAPEVVAPKVVAPMRFRHRYVPMSDEEEDGTYKTGNPYLTKC